MECSQQCTVTLAGEKSCKLCQIYIRLYENQRVSEVLAKRDKLKPSRRFFLISQGVKEGVTLWIVTSWLKSQWG